MARVMNTPKMVDLSITNRCNLRCKYCSHFDSAGDVGGDLPKEEWLRFFEELNRYSVTRVSIEGGEAFVRDDLKEIIMGVVQNRMRFSILSNGTLITDEMAAFIGSTRRCDLIQLSIDGSIPITHDFSRGKGTFYRVMNGLDILQRNSAPVTVRVTIHKKNVNDLENTAKLLLEDVGLPSFSTNSASYMGLCRKNSEQLQLNAQERSLAMEILLKLSRKYGSRVSAMAGPLAEASDWMRIEKARKEGNGGLHDRGYLTSCRGMFNKLAVRADGAIVPCNQLSHIELGRINKDDIREIWHESPELNKLRERMSIPLSSFEFCNGCEYQNYCAGGCPALAYNYFGDVYHPSPDSCLKRFLEDGGRLPYDI